MEQKYQILQQLQEDINLDIMLFKQEELGELSTRRSGDGGNGYTGGFWWR